MYSTKNWITGILIGAFVATFFVGMFHGMGLIEELENPLIHTLRDWLIVVVFLLPITYGIARFLPDN